MADSLKQKVTSGVAWISIQRFSSMGIQFLSGVVLARLLTPDDYGCIGMLAIFMVIANTVVDSGFGSALIQKKRPTQEDYSTIFFFNLGMSFLMYAILFYAAPLIAKFYRIPLLCSVLRVQGLVLIINSFSQIQSNQLRKQFRLKKIAIVSLMTTIISFAVTIFMAYRGFGVWSLVALYLLSSFIPATIYWFTNKWYPIMVFSMTSFKELFRFGFFMCLTSIITNICNNIQGLLIGRFYTPAIMGYYTKAKNTEELASMSISNIMGQVTYPLYAEYQHNLPALINVIKRITNTVAFITFPLMALLILLAKPAFLLLYSARWLDSVPYFQLLCLAGIAICLQSVNYQAVAAVGKSKQMFSWTLVKRVIGLVLVVTGLAAFGIKGLLIGMVMQSWIIYLINAYQVHKYIGYSIVIQLFDLLPIMILVLVSWSIAYVIGFIFSDCHIYILSIIRFFIFVMIYLGGSFILNMQSFRYVKESLSLLLKKNQMK